MEGHAALVMAVLVMTLALHSVDCKPSPLGTSPESPQGQQDRSLSRRQTSYGEDNHPASEQFLSGLQTIGQFLLNLILQRVSSDNGGGLGAANVQQDDMDSYLTDILADELMREYQEYMDTGILPQVPPYQPRVRQQDSPAEASFFSSQNWEIARECLNDIFAPDDDDDEDGGDSGLTDQVRRAFISEARSVWTGRTPLSQASAQIRLNWPVIRDCVDRYTNQNNPPSAQAEFLDFIVGECNTGLVVMAFTGGSTNALTNDPPSVELTVGGEVSSVTLPTLSGNEFQQNKGDMWYLDLNDFGFTDTCIRQWDVDGIAIVEGGTDGWLIESIVTFLQDKEGEFSLLSSDIGVNAWIDGNGGAERRRVDLTID